MNKLEMKMQATEIVREAVRQSGVARTASVTDRIPEILEAVEFDSEYLRNHVETVLNRKTGNPINALLRLMGLRVVSTHNAAETLGLEEEETFTVGFDGDDRNTESMLKLNRNTLSAAVEKITADLAETEEAFRAERQSSRSESSRIFAELEKKNQECAQLGADLQGQRNAVMENCQYILSLLGPDGGQPQVTRQICEMLEDLGAHVYWSAEGAPFSDGAMFLELKCDDPASRRGKPCLADESGVLVKGVRFVGKDPEPEESAAEPEEPEEPAPEPEEPAAGSAEPDAV